MICPLVVLEGAASGLFRPKEGFGGRIGNCLEVAHVPDALVAPEALGPSIASATEMAAA
jgi:hypothetical protein